jgi:hypothetical protein
MFMLSIVNELGQFFQSWKTCFEIVNTTVQYSLHSLISGCVTHPSWPLQCVTPATVTCHGSSSLPQHKQQRPPIRSTIFPSPIHVPVMALLLPAVHERTLAPACIPFVPTEPRSEKS